MLRALVDPLDHRVSEPSPIEGVILGMSNRSASHERSGLDLARRIDSMASLQ
jgi:hypothetical protein